MSEGSPEQPPFRFQVPEGTRAAASGGVAARATVWRSCDRRCEAASGLPTRALRHRTGPESYDLRRIAPPHRRISPHARTEATTEGAAPSHEREDTTWKSAS